MGCFFLPQHAAPPTARPRLRVCKLYRDKLSLPFRELSIRCWVGARVMKTLQPLAPAYLGSRQIECKLLNSPSLEADKQNANCSTLAEQRAHQYHIHPQELRKALNMTNAPVCTHNEGFRAKLFLSIIDVRHKK